MRELYTNRERIMQWITAILIIISIMVRGYMGIQSVGELVISGYVAYVVFLMFLVIALFPVSKNGIDTKENKKKELKEYREKHRITLAWISFSVCLVLDFVILFIEP